MAAQSSCDALLSTRPRRGNRIFCSNRFCVALNLAGTMNGLALVLALAVAVRSEFPLEQECPEDCDCHYFRVNYVTDCSESNFTEIPYDEISPNVFILDMNGNEITDIRPFPENIKIRRLQLAENKLTAVTADMFVGLKYMLDIDLSGNRIATVDPDSFRDSHGLITVELQNNPLSPVAEGSFLRCPSLLYLDLSNCNLTSVNEEFFSETPVISHLDLSDNPLTELPAPLFHPLAVLEELKLNKCNLTYLDPNLLARQNLLKVLELSDNYLTGVDWSSLFGKLYRLENLNLRKANVKNLPADVFINNTFLRYVTLSDNELTDLDIGTTLGENLRNLHSLDLSNCNLKGPLDQNSFINATTLKSLNLASNRLSSRDLSIALVPLKKLTSLTLQNCSLSRLPKDTFENLSQLRELDISWNPLNKVFDELLDSLRNLEYLNMGYSNLSRLSNDTFSRTLNLKKLILSGNKLRELEPGLFKSLRHLETLEIENCGLEKAIEEDVFYNKTNGDLLELKMSRNPLRVDGPVIPEQLSKLRVLDLSKCNISYLPDESFANAKNLRRLLLSGNNLTTELMNSSRFLDALPELEYLDLSGNNLTALPTRVISGNNLKDVKLTNNPWICDCTLAEWWNWALEQGDISHLIGSTLTLEDITKKGTKRKRGLLCSFDSKVTPPTRKNATRKFPPRARNESVRTWARYLKESNCHIKKITTEQGSELHTFFPEPILPSPQPARFGPKRSNANAVTFIGVALVVTLVTALCISVRYIRVD